MKKKKLKILFLDILTDNKYLRKDIEEKVYNGSTYAEEMRKALGLKKNQFVSKDASKGKLPNPNNYSAIVIGGSVKDPVKGQEKPWMFRVYKVIRSVQKEGIPLLGICGGLQFAVKALGGEVVYNSKGRNFGSAPTKLTKDGQKDPLFRDLPSSIVVQSSHKCIAKGLLPDWRLLARSDKSPFDGIAIGDNIRLLQFHPEMSVGIARGIANMRKESFVGEGFVSKDNFPKLVKSLKDTTRGGKKILNNFLKYYVKLSN